MYYTYVLQSVRNHQFYIGSTLDLKRRFEEHNQGKSEYTKKFLPWKLIYYEAYKTSYQAIHREHALKRRAKSWQELLKRLEIKR